MVTTTASPLRTSSPPRYRNTDPLPEVKPPPCMKTITGRPRSGAFVGDSGNAGVQMLSDRQSSLCGSEAAGSAGLVTPGTAADCGAIGPKVDASRTSLQVSASNGGRHRNAPTGARPYGIPENDQ